MTLDSYLTENAITEPEFAKALGVNQSTVNRLRKTAIPSRDLMERIVSVTNSQVTPNDFFGVAA